jgi:predicted  nucleic acid-binding Zn-ribbon protein
MQSDTVAPPQKKWFQTLGASGRAPGRVIVMTPESHQRTVPSAVQQRGGETQNSWISSMAAALDGPDSLRENRFPSEDNSIAGLTPVPPSLPKRSHAMPTKGEEVEAGFQNTFNSTSAKGSTGSLVMALASMVDEGLRSLPPIKNDIESKLLRLDIYRAAFQHLIDEFNIYRPFLSSVKSEYDSVLHSFSDDVRTVESLRLEAILKEKELTAKLNQAQKKHAADIANKDAEIVRLNDIIRSSAADRDKLRDQFDAVVHRCSTLEKELSDLRASCLNLTNSLARTEDDRRLVQANEHNKAIELQAMKTALLRSTEEVTA